MNGIVPPRISACNPRFSNQEKEMKNLTSTMFLLALASAICLFAPAYSLAQDGGDDPCCFNAPPSATVLANSEIQSQISLFQIAHNRIDLIHEQLPAYRATMPAIEESGRLMICRRQS